MTDEIKEIEKDVTTIKLLQVQQTTDIGYIKDSVKRIESSVSSVSAEQETRYAKIDDRIRELEVWRIGFTTKFYIYSIIVIAILSIGSQIAVNYLTSKF